LGYVKAKLWFQVDLYAFSLMGFGNHDSVPVNHIAYINSLIQLWVAVMPLIIRSSTTITL